MTTIEKIQSEYPLHWAVWNDDHKELQDLIKTKKVSMPKCVGVVVAMQTKDREFFKFAIFNNNSSGIAICSNQFSSTEGLRKKKREVAELKKQERVCVLMSKTIICFLH